MCHCCRSQWFRWKFALLQAVFEQLLYWNLCCVSVQDSCGCSVYQHTAVLFFLPMDNLHLLDCSVTWSLLTQTDADWTCWVAANAWIWKHKHRFEHDSDSCHTVHPLYTAYKQYTTGSACCVYQRPTKRRHSRQLMPGRSRRRNTFSKIFKKQHDGNMTNIAKLPSRTLFAANWKLSMIVLVFWTCQSAMGTRQLLWCFCNWQ